MEQSKSFRISSLETELFRMKVRLEELDLVVRGAATARQAEEIGEIRERLRELLHTSNRHEREIKLMADATADLKAAQAKIDKAVQDTADFLRTIAEKLTGSVSASDAETIAADLNAQADALEAAIAPPPVV